METITRRNLPITFKGSEGALLLLAACAHAGTDPPAAIPAISPLLTTGLQYPVFAVRIIARASAPVVVTERGKSRFHTRESGAAMA